MAEEYNVFVSGKQKKIDFVWKGMGENETSVDFSATFPFIVTQILSRVLYLF